jgi:hypothetical protein
MSKQAQIERKKTKRYLTVDDFEKFDCTYVLCGDTKIIQQAYNCSICDPKKIYPFCSKCLKCHNSCLQKGSLIEQIDKSTKMSFICYCGKELLHIIRKQQENNCDLSRLFTEEKDFFKCQSCSINLCQICKAICHRSCTKAQPLAAKECNPLTCCCTDDNHGINEFVFSEIPKFVRRFGYADIYQFLYKIFNMEAMVDFSSFIKNSFEKILSNSLAEVEKSKLDEVFKGFYSIINKSKNSFYFHDELKNLFTHELIQKCIKIENYKTYAFDLLFLFERIHIRNDFRAVKTFTVYDYFNSSIIERLQNREFIINSISKEVLHKYRVYESLHHKKHHSNLSINTDGKFSLVRMTFELIESLDNDAITNTHLQIILKYLYFVLRLHIFNLDELIYIIRLLYKNYDLNMHYKIIREKNFSYADVIERFTKVLYIIGVNYNDLIVLNFINERVGKKKFIHAQSEHSEMLFKLVLKNNICFSNNLLFEKRILSKKFYLINNEILKLFIISNNNYHDNFLKSRTFNKIQNINLYRNIYELLNYEENKPIYDCFNNFKLALIEEKENYFKMNTENIFERINIKVGDFISGINSFFKNKHSNKSPTNLHSVIKYKDKLHDFILELFPGLNPHILNNTDFIIDAFKMFNIDELYANLIFVLRCHDTDKTTKLFLNNLGLFTFLLFNSNGLYYILRGNTLKKFYDFITPKNKTLIDFIQIMFEGINVYHIEVKVSRKISKILGLLFQSVMFRGDKCEINQAVKIFSEVSKFYDKEESKQLIASLVYYLVDQGIMNNGAFIASLTQMNDDRYNLISIKTLIKEYYFKNVNYMQTESDAKSEFDLLKYKTSGMNFEMNEMRETDDTHKNDHKYKRSSRNLYINTYQLYLSLFKLLAENIYYIPYFDKFRDTVMHIDSFNNLECFKVALGNTFLRLNQRKTILKFILSFYFIDYIKEYDNTKYVSTVEYLDYCDSEEKEKSGFSEKIDYFEQNAEYENIKIVEEVGENNKDPIFDEKITFIKNLYSVLDIFIQEYDNVLYFLFASEVHDFGKIFNYLKNLVISMKFISDFFYEKKKLYKDGFSNHISIQFYKVARSFLKTSHIIKKALTLISLQDMNKFRFKLIEHYYENISLENCENYKIFDTIQNFFDVKAVYNCITNEINKIITIFDKDGIYSLSKNLFYHDKAHSKNYFTIGLTFDGPYEVIYKDFKTEKINKEDHIDGYMRVIFNTYLEQFYDIKRTSFLSIMSNVSTEDSTDYRILLSNYFVNHINNYSHISGLFDTDVINMITKLLYFDGKGSQQAIYSIVSANSDFFVNYFCHLKRNLVLAFTTARNCFISKEFYELINKKTELMILFLQLLGEGFCKKFTDSIFKTKQILIKKDHIFSGVRIYETTTLSYLNDNHNSKVNNDILFILHRYLESQKKQKMEMEEFREFKKMTRRDRNIGSIEFSVEEIEHDDDDIEIEENENKEEFYFYKSNSQNFADFDANLFEAAEVNIYFFLFYKLFTLQCYLSLSSSIDSELPNDNLIVLQTQIINFLIEFNGVCEDYSLDIIDKFDHDEFILRKIRSILLNRGEGFSPLRMKILLLSKLNYLRLLISIVQNENLSKNLLKLNKKINLFNLFEEVIYYMNTLIIKYRAEGKISHDKTLNHRSIVQTLKSLYIENIEFEKTLELEFCITTFKYIKIIGELHKVNGIESYYEDNRESIIYDWKERDHKAISLGTFNSIAGLNVYDFLSHLVSMVEIRVMNDQKEYTSHSIFFVKPPITFLLSEQTKFEFSQNVDRTNASTKLNELLERTDYFLFEMFFNYNLAIQNKFNVIFRTVRMDYLEMFNYLIILAQQVQLLHYFFISNLKEAQPEGQLSLFDPDIKFTVKPGNFILSVIHCIYCGIILLCWSKFYLELNYQKIMMKKYNVNFLIANTDEDKNVNLVKFTDNFAKDNQGLLLRLNDNVTIWQKLYTSIFDMFVLNRMVSIYIYTFALVLLYLVTQHPIFLVIPVLFITNFMPLLTSIIYAVRLKWKQLGLVLFFTYMVVYLFGWLGFFYLYGLYDTDTTNMVVNNLLTFRAMI